ncbi:MAG: sulfite exporter TauE/SafE family protein [Hyphomicrobiaceae bacterium]|nr:MAG: sulfite exporter TauE/SafE family protein [Hyphomicrobiaceae bacterium]
MSPEPTLLAIAVGGLFAAGIVKGATGLGYSSCALPFLVAAIGLKPAMALVIIPALATNVAVALSAGHFQEIARRFAPLYLSMLPGIGLGLALLIWIDPRIAVTTLGLVIVGYAVMALTKPRLALSAGAASRLQVPAGLLNGVLTGLTGSQVMPLFPYMMALDLDNARLVQAINMAVLLASSILAAGLLVAGIMTFEILGLSLVAVAPALVGCEIGSRARARIPSQSFRSIVLVVLLLMGVLLMVR